MRQPNFFNNGSHGGWRGYAQRTAPDMVRSETFCQYQPYFVGQELEIARIQAAQNTAAYGRLRQASSRLASRTSKMVRRFLEL
jgi:hypothetical protein